MKISDILTWEAGFINSKRGHYILAKALTIAAKELDKVEGTKKEISDISDMDYMLKNYLSAYIPLLSNIEDK